MKEQRTKIGIIVSAAAISSAVTFILTSFFTLQTFNKKVENVNNLSETYTSLKELDSYVRNNYYSEIDDDNIKDAILKGYVSGLNDKYSRYLSAKEYKSFKDTESGNSTGIGITVSQTEEGYIKIEDVVEEGPSAEEGIKAGDIIVSVDGSDVSEIGYESSVDAIKGEEGSKVVLTVLRDNNEFDVTVTRKTYEVKTVKYEMIDNNIGYINITAFRTNTVNQFQTALNSLIAEGAKSFIFDVRENGGGLLTSLEDILDPLLPEGDIATANYIGGKTETVVSSDSESLDLPMVVLVNENTASAAELFACSLRDFGSASLVGTQTYGKGVMQNTVELGNGGAVTLTVATYQTTKSECYNEIGLVPDEVVENKNDNDLQLKKAISILKK